MDRKLIETMNKDEMIERIELMQLQRKIMRKVAMMHVITDKEKLHAMANIIGDKNECK